MNATNHHEDNRLQLADQPLIYPAQAGRVLRRVTL